MLADYRAVVLADAPKAFWLMGLAELGPSPGFPTDLTGHGFDVTSSDGNPATNIAYYQSLLLHGETGGVKFTNSEFVAPVVPTTGDWAMEVWVLNSSVSSGGLTLAYNGHWTGASGGDGYGLATNSAHTVTVIANGFNDSISPAPSISIGLAAGGDQLVISYNSTTHGISFWHNGVPAPANPYTGWTHFPLAPTTAMYIAKNQGASFTLANETNLAAAIWDSQLTDAKVLAHYNAMVGLANVDGDYPFLSLVHPGGGTQQPATGRVTIL